jgi:hypothetical protein
MNAEPISKELFDKLTAAGINEVKLSFSGGSDEGYLDVTTYPRLDPGDRNASHLIDEVEKWAWDTYSYSGAGEGIDYGDEIVYDLVNKKVRTSEWTMERTDRELGDDDLEIEE